MSPYKEFQVRMGKMDTLSWEKIGDWNPANPASFLCLVAIQTSSLGQGSFGRRNLHLIRCAGY
jgi:hypothetical protein